MEKERLSMNTPPTASEPTKLTTLRQYRILNSSPEQAFDDIARRAATICGTPIAAISFVEGSRQWFKSTIGLSLTELARSTSFCLEAIGQPGVLVVSDALEDERFANSPLATKKPYIRFYAGAPMVAPDGSVVGVISVMNTEPGDLTRDQADSLQRLGRQVIEVLELRKTVWNLEAAVTKRKKVTKVLEARNRDLTAQKSELEAQKHLLEQNTEDMVQGTALYEYASQRFLELFQGLPVACYCYDSRGRIFEWNRAFEDLYGRTAENTLLQTVWDTVCSTDKDIERTQESVLRVFEGEAIEGIERADLRADGSTCIVLCNTFPIRHPDGTIVGGISANIDITERRKAEEALRQSEERYRQIFHNNGAIKILIDAETGAFVDANPAACAYFGFSIEALRGFKLWDIAASPEAETRKHLAAAAAEQRNFYHLQNRLASGEVRDVAVHAGPVDVQGKRYVYAIVHDVTERIRAEEGLRESELRFRSVTQSANDGIIMVDSADKVIFWNGGAQSIFMYEEEVILGQSLTRLLPGLYEHPHALAPHAAETLDKAGLIGKTLELTAVRKDGTRMPVEVSLASWSTDQGVFCSGIIRDVTERKQYEQQLQDQMEQINNYSAELEFHKQRLEAINKKLEALAKLDGMTGLKNHRAFQERLVSEFQRAVRYSTPLSLILLDVDHFKSYNDKFGHPAGDEVLKQVAQKLQENARGVDFVARYGGEEFVVILPHTDREGALALADRFRIAIEKSEWPSRPITASFGVATLNPAIKDPQDLIGETDKALYVSKARGRNRVTHAGDVSNSILDSFMPAGM
jgi:diguanylate cyclase (GGDEF)-like protein/PAS domain S-box-containing protein